MKRKLALLLAAVMTLSMLPMNVFAATSNSVTRSTTVVPEKTLLHEDGVGGSGQFGTLAGTNDRYMNGDIQYMTDAGYLIMEINDKVAAGEVFRLKLENAKWFFRSKNDGYSASIASAAAINVPGTISTGAYYSASTDGYSSGAPEENITYDVNKGVFQLTSGSKIGDYYRFADFTDADHQEVPYKLSVSPLSDKEATVEILEIYDKDANDIYPGSAPIKGQKEYNSVKDSKYRIRIPLVSLTTEKDVDVRVKIEEGSSTISGSTHKYGIAGDALTKTYVDDLKSGRDTIKIPKLIIKESRLNSIKNGNFYISAPSGFEFGITDAVVGVDTGLKWGDTSVGTKPRSATNFYSLSYRNNDADQVKVEIRNILESGTAASTSIPGAIYIEGLTIYPDDDDSTFWGDIMLSIKNDDGFKMLTNETFKGGTRTDWTLSLTTTGTIPELVNGRYQKEIQAQAEDEIHQTARVIFAENSVAAWWAERDAVFQLPEGVKYRKVEFVKSEKLINSKSADVKIEDTFSSPIPGDGIKKSVGDNGSITINGNKMTLKNFKVKANEKAKITMDVWVSIESGFAGDVTMTVVNNGNEVPPVVIAKQITPITISTKISDIKIGYQLQPTADIVITETKAGNLMKNKTMKISITDFSSADVSFSPDTKIAVTDGNLKIKNIGVTNNTASSESSLSTTGGTLKFDIDSASSKASTISITGVSVKADRTIPESNDRPYKVVAWGSAVAENYNNMNNAPKDTFATPGVMADYMRIITSANDKSSLLSQRVEIAAGESTYVVNGETVEMDAAAYISLESSSMLVPVRFIANAFGINDDQVIWSDEGGVGALKTVTVIHQGTTVQFIGGSDQMFINGVAVTNTTGTTRVKAEISPEGRMYVPFRALGEAFGVKVAYEDSTKTATYNPDVVVSAK